MTEKKKREGPKELIDDERIETLMQSIKAGAHTETAAAFAGIHRVTFYRWLKRGQAEIKRVTETPRARYRKSEAKYVELCNAIDHALAACEIGDIIITSKASQQGDWKAAAWRLEHRFKDRWGTKQEIDTKVSEPDGGPVQIRAQLEAMTPEELREKTRELIKEAEWLDEEEQKLQSWATQPGMCPGDKGAGRGASARDPQKG